MKTQFDCFDFCKWSLGENYDFRYYTEPDSTIYYPSIEDLVDETDK